MTKADSKMTDDVRAARNTCRLCTPYGGVLAMLGVENCVPLLHGSQGCSTYIRRHMIGHFREPVDVASSNFHESQAVFGGRDNLFAAIQNVTRQYHPEVIGIATTCLAETIGDNIPMFMHEFWKTHDKADFPELMNVSTASYRGSHADGFFATQRSLVERFAEKDSDSPAVENAVNIVPAMVSCEDLRTLKSEVAAFGLAPTLLCDYSDRLDGGSWEEYKLIPPGGTPLRKIKAMSRSSATIELSTTQPNERSAGHWLEENCGVPMFRMMLPMGIRNCDRFYNTLSQVSGRPVPAEFTSQRARLVDAYIDGHKYLFGKKAVVYGEEDLVAAVVAMLLEVGVTPAVCGTCGDSQSVRTVLMNHDASAAKKLSETVFMSRCDFTTMQEIADRKDIDIVIGNSSGLKLSRALNAPLLRIGMPVHDRIGAARIRLLGYRGTLEFFDRLCNVFMERMQDDSEIAPIGYTHI